MGIRVLPQGICLFNGQEIHIRALIVRTLLNLAGLESQAGLLFRGFNFVNGLQI